MATCVAPEQPLPSTGQVEPRTAACQPTGMSRGWDSMPLTLWRHSQPQAGGARPAQLLGGRWACTSCSSWGGGWWWVAPSHRWGASAHVSGFGWHGTACGMFACCRSRRTPARLGEATGLGEVGCGRPPTHQPYTPTLAADAWLPMLLPEHVGLCGEGRRRVLGRDAAAAIQWSALHTVSSTPPSHHLAVGHADRDQHQAKRRLLVDVGMPGQATSLAVS